jgi:hypothetical protein
MPDDNLSASMAKPGEHMANNVPQSIEYKTLMITPKMASELLKKNTLNRPLRPSKVRQWAALMVAGKWELTHQGIAIDEDDCLLDGQHRLQAIVMSGKTVVMTVARAPRATFGLIDTQQPRSVSDATGLPSDTAAVASVLVRAALMRHGSRPTNIAAARAVADHVTSLREFCPTVRRKFSASPIKAAAITMAVLNDDQTYAYLGYRHLVTDKLSELTPTQVALYRYLIDTGSRHSGGGAGTVESYCRACVAFDEKKQGLSRIQINELDKFQAMAREVLGILGVTSIVSNDVTAAAVGRG